MDTLHKGDDDDGDDDHGGDDDDDNNNNSNNNNNNNNNNKGKLQLTMLGPYPVNVQDSSFHWQDIILVLKQTRTQHLLILQSHWLSLQATNVEEEYKYQELLNCSLNEETLAVDNYCYYSGHT